MMMLPADVFLQYYCYKHFHDYTPIFVSLDHCDMCCCQIHLVDTTDLKKVAYFLSFTTEFCS